MRNSIRKRSTKSREHHIAENTQASGNSSHKSLISKAGLEGRIDTLNPDVTERGSSNDTVVYTKKKRCFSFVDMLLVKIFMSILYSTVIKSQV